MLSDASCNRFGVDLHRDRGEMGCAAARDLSAYTVVASLQHVHGCLSGVLANCEVIPPFGILGRHWPRLQRHLMGARMAPAAPQAYPGAA